MPNKKILLFTLTYDRLDYLKLMIKSLEDTVDNYNKIDHLFIVQGDEETKSYLSDLPYFNRYVIWNETNKGLPAGWNKAIIFGLEDEYDYIIKCDDDAIFKTKGWLDDALKVIDSVSYPFVLSPTVGGLVANKGGVPRYLKTEINGISLGFTPHLGGISLITTRKVYEMFGGFDENDPMHSGQDVKFSQELIQKGVRFAYLEDHIVNHGPLNTSQQEVDYPEYFSRRINVEKKKSLREI